VACLASYRISDVIPQSNVFRPIRRAINLNAFRDLVNSNVSVKAFSPTDVIIRSPSPISLCFGISVAGWRDENVRQFKGKTPDWSSVDARVDERVKSSRIEENDRIVENKRNDAK